MALNPYMAPPQSSAASQDLLNKQFMQKTQDELDAAKKRKKVLGPNASPLGSAAVMSLTGNQY